MRDSRRAGDDSWMRRHCWAVVPAGSMFAFLAAHRTEVFPDADYADLFALPGVGRPASGTVSPLGHRPYHPPPQLYLAQRAQHAAHMRPRTSARTAASSRVASTTCTC